MIDRHARQLIGILRQRNKTCLRQTVEMKDGSEWLVIAMQVRTEDGNAQKNLKPENTITGRSAIKKQGKDRGEGGSQDTEEVRVLGEEGSAE